MDNGQNKTTPTAGTPQVQGKPKPTTPAEPDSTTIKRARNTSNYDEDAVWQKYERWIGTAKEGRDDDFNRLKRAKGAADDNTNQLYSTASEEDDGSGRATINSTKEADVHTAEACGLPPYAPNEEEDRLLPGGCNEETYATVRNYILAKWRANVSRYLSEEDALSGLSKRDKPYGYLAWQYLNALGYINFGLLNTTSTAGGGRNKQPKKPATSRGSVVIVGAGCAGIAAAKQLIAKGYTVIIAEGRTRPGGRVHTIRMEGPNSAAVADLGGSILTGIDGNPCAIVAKQMGAPLVDIDSETPLFMPDGTPADAKLDAAIEKLHNKLLDACEVLRDSDPVEAETMALGPALESFWEAEKHKLGLDDSKEGRIAARQLFDWHMANLEFANALLLDQLSLTHWDQDDPNELQGAHCFVPGGNYRWLQKLCSDVPILYNSPVREIRYSAQGVAVHTDKRILYADAVVVTVSLGVLKKKSIVFNPPLPDSKLASINRLGFGNLNKVVLLFPSPFWGDDLDMFGHVAPSQETRGESFLFYSYAHISGGHLLIALSAGRAADEQESRTPEENASRVMTVLHNIFQPKGIKVPAPLSVVCTNWGSDPYAYGAYSSMAVGTIGGKDYDTLGQSIAHRVFFAGEATSSKYPATMHGAFYTGLWTAANVDATLKKLEYERLNPPPATIIVAPVRVVEQQQRVVEPEVPAAAATAPVVVENSRLLNMAADLSRLFTDPNHPPDLEFGCFLAIHGPVGTEYAAISLVRIDLSKYQAVGSQPLYIYIFLPIDVALGLADVVGDEARISMLSTLPGVDLVNRPPPSADVEGLMQAVFHSRRQLNTTTTTQPVQQQVQQQPVSTQDADGEPEEIKPKKKKQKTVDSEAAGAAPAEKKHAVQPDSVAPSEEGEEEEEKPAANGTTTTKHLKRDSTGRFAPKKAPTADTTTTTNSKKNKKDTESTQQPEQKPESKERTTRRSLEKIISKVKSSSSTKPSTAATTTSKAEHPPRPSSGGGSTAKKGVPIPDPQVEAIKCSKCRKKHPEDTMLLCDDCDRGYHMECLKPPLTKVPRGHWYCELCSKKRKDEGKGSDDDEVAAIRCTHCRKLKPEDTMLLCDDCDRGCHMECLKPPMTKVPKGKWYCQPCEKKRKDNDTCPDDDPDIASIRCTRCRKKHPEDTMLLCDSCDRGYHMECLKPPLSRVPKGDWYCPMCEKKAKEEACSDDDPDVAALRCTRCRKKEPEDTMLLCDGCDRGYHMECLKPPLTKVPKGDWFCQHCAKKRKDGGENTTASKKK